MLSVRRSRTIAVAALVAALLVLLPVVALSRRASAAVPDPDLAAAIYQLIRATPGAPPMLPGPDGIPGPDKTNDGQGAFVYFENGPTTTVPIAGPSAAIFAYREPKGGIVAHWIRHPALAWWRASGAERGYGYPVSELRPFEIRDVRRGCFAGDHVQYFRRLIPGPRDIHVFCHGPQGDSWHLVR